MKGDPRFHEELKRIGDLHDAKQSDYGRKEDPFANVRASEEWGMPPWVGAMIRANDKMKRLQKAARGGTMTNEAVEDSFQDLAVYALIGLILYREQGGEAGVREPRGNGGPAGDQPAEQLYTDWDRWEDELAKSVIVQDVTDGTAASERHRYLSEGPSLRAEPADEDGEGEVHRPNLRHL